jgi:hypothetical protein
MAACALLADAMQMRPTTHVATDSVRMFIMAIL